MTPELIIALSALVLLIIDAFCPNIPKRYLALLGTLPLAWAFGYLISNPIIPLPSEFWQGFQSSIDDVYTPVFQGIILIATILSLFMMIGSRFTINQFVTGNRRHQDGTGELYILPLFACAGMLWMIKATNFITLFVSLELVTLTFYIMVGYLRRNVGSLEGGVKYLITGALSTGLLVFGIAWIYGTTGSFEFGAPLAETISTIGMTPGLAFGIVLVFLGLLFKVGGVPMHAWVPDVYQGAPTPVTALLSVASKTAGFYVLAVFLVPLLSLNCTQTLSIAFTVVIIATLLVGNWGAIAQTNVKRMMAYSSIGHAGFMLPLLYSQSSAFITGYLACYAVMTYAAFFILSIVRNQTGREDLVAFNGLAKRNPKLAFVTTFTFASLAGVPLTCGFTAKFISFFAIIQNGLWGVLVVAVIAAAAGFYYYFKVIRAMYVEPSPEGAPDVRMSLLNSILLALLTASNMLLGLAILNIQIH